MSDLFAGPFRPGRAAPLADRLRPKSLAEVAGQDHLVGKDGALSAFSPRLDRQPDLLGPRERARPRSRACRPRDGPGFRADFGNLSGVPTSRSF